MVLDEGYSDQIEAAGCRDQYGGSQVRLTFRRSLSYQMKGVVLWWWFYLDHLQMLPRKQHQLPQPLFPK